MKKYMLTLVAILAAFILSACGGGSSGDAGNASSDKAMILANAGKIIFSTSPISQGTAASSDQDFYVQVWYQKTLNDNYNVEVYTESIEIMGCTVISDSVVFNPNPVILNGNTGSMETLTVTGKVNADCTNSTNYRLLGKVKTTLGSSTTEELFDVTSGDINNPTDPTDPKDGQYTLTNVTSPIVVNYDNEVKNISVYVIDENGVGVPDQNVSIQAINDIRFGAIISASTVQTDTSGKASFVYEAPNNVKAVDGNITNVDLLLSGNTILEKRTVEIRFNKIDKVEVKPIVVVDNQYKDVNLTSNSQSITMEVRVFEEGTNTPYTQGVIKVKLPSKVLDGVDVGTFVEYEAVVNSSGVATFIYTGPRDLWALVNKGDRESEFQFYHEDNPEQSQSIIVHYEPTGSYQPTQYIVKVSSSDGNNTMNLDSQKSFVIELKDDQGTLIDSNQVQEVRISTENQQIGILVDENTGVESTTLLYRDDDAVNPKSFHVKVGTLSGIVPISISIHFLDANNNQKIVDIVISIVVFSGPPTAMSISYVGVEHNATVGKFIEKFTVSVTDAYNNPVNTHPYISTGAMVEYAVDGSSPTGERNTTSPRLWHGAYDSLGTLNRPNRDTNKTSFISDIQNVFRYIDINNDKLVLFGAGYVYEALGKWDIDKDLTPIIPSDELFIKDNYFGNERKGLYYAVGHNNRQDLCSSDGREYIGNMRSGTYKLDENGHAFIEFEYDYHLTGKDIMVWVNLTGFQADDNKLGRIGEAQKHTLRGNGFKSDESYTVAPGETVIVPFYIHHKNVPEWYKNGHFGYAFAPSACTIDAIIDSSNQHDARDCNNVVSYTIVQVTNNGPKNCSIELNDDSIAVSSEFQSGLQITFP